MQRSVKQLYRMASSQKKIGTVSASTTSTAMKTQFYRRPLPSSCIDFSSEDGKRIFSEALNSGHMNAFFKLCSQFRTQDEPAYCGLTSLVMALNVLEIDPGRIWKGPWRWYHEDMLDCCTPLSVARDKGINMEQFICLAKCNNLTVKEKSAFEIISVDEVRDEIKQATSRDDIVLVASYSRKILGQTGDGHFSPIAGYHEGLDLVLILDTARFKYPPHWVPVKLLLDAMRTIDSETGRTRGYVMLSASKNQAGLLLLRPSCSFAVDTTKGHLNQEIMDFSKEWGLWLSNIEEVEPDQIHVMHEAIECLLDLKNKGYFFSGLFCLTIPSIVKEDNCKKHIVLSCPKMSTDGEEITCVIQTLIKELESLSIFKVVSEFLMTKTNQEREVFINMIQTDACCKDLCEHYESFQSQYKIQENSKSELGRNLNCTGGRVRTACCKENKCSPHIDEAGMHVMTQKLLTETLDDSSVNETIIIGPEHAVTLFLLAWPHSYFLSKASGSLSDSRNSTLGEKLIKFISSDLNKLGGRYIKDEVNTTMLKIREVMKFHNKESDQCCF